MKRYTIIHQDTNLEYGQDYSWFNIDDLVNYQYLKKTSGTFEDFLTREKEFLQLTENFINYFGVENLYYKDNISDMEYKDVLEAELERDRYPEEDVREMIKKAYNLAISDMKEVIKKSFVLDPDDYDEKIFIKNKEEALSTMHLNFRNLLWTELKDSKTGAFLDTGNGGLDYDIYLPDDVDINIFLKDVHDLKIYDEGTYSPEEEDDES